MAIGYSELSTDELIMQAETAKKQLPAQAPIQGSSYDSLSTDDLISSLEGKPSPSFAKGLGYSALAGFQSGGSALLGGLGSAMEYAGMPVVGGLLKKPAAELVPKAEESMRKAEEYGATGLTKFLGEVIGGAGPGVAHFVAQGAAGVPIVAGIEGAARAKAEGKSELWGFAVGAAERYALGKLFEGFRIGKPSIARDEFIQLARKEGSQLPEEVLNSAWKEATKTFKGVNSLPLLKRAPAMAAVFGGQSAANDVINGKPINMDELAKSVGTGLLYALMPGGKPNKGLTIANRLRIGLAEDAVKKGDFKSLETLIGDIKNSQPDIVDEAIRQTKTGLKEEDVANSYLALKKMGEEKKPEAKKEVEPIISPTEKIEESPVAELPVTAPEEEIAPVVRAEEVKVEEAKAPPVEEVKAPEAITKEAVSSKIKELEDLGKVEEAGVLREAFEIPKEVSLEEAGLRKEEEVGVPTKKVTDFKELRDSLEQKYKSEYPKDDDFSSSYAYLKANREWNDKITNEFESNPEVKSIVDSVKGKWTIVRKAPDGQHVIKENVSYTEGRKELIKNGFLTEDDRGDIFPTGRSTRVVANDGFVTELRPIDADARVEYQKVVDFAKKAYSEEVDISIERPEVAKPLVEAPVVEAPAKIEAPTVQRMDISKPETIVSPIVDLISKRNEAEKAGDKAQVDAIQVQARNAKALFWAKADKDERAGRVTREQTMKAWEEIQKAEDATMTPKQKVKKDVVDVLEGNEREDIDQIMTPEEYKTEVIDKIPEPTAAELKMEEEALKKEIRLSNARLLRASIIRRAKEQGRSVEIKPLKEEIERAPTEKQSKADADEMTKILRESGDIDGVIDTGRGYRRKGPKELKPEEDMYWGVSEDEYRIAKDYFTKGTKEKLFGGGPDLEYMQNLTTWAKYSIGKGVKKFEEFASSTIKEFGEHVRPYLLKAWQAAQTEYKLQTEVYNSGYRIADPSVAAKWNNGAPVATLTDLQSVKNAVNDLPKGLYDLKGWLKTPERAFNYMQAANPGTDFKSLLRQWRHAQKQQTVASNLVSEQIQSFKKQISKQEFREVSLFSYGEQPGGKRIVEEFMKMKVPTWESLSPKAQQVYKFVRSQYEWVWKELNKMRVAVGEEPVGYIENYSPFAMAKAIEYLEKNGMDVATAPKEAIEKAFVETGFEFTHPKMTKFEYENRQMAMQNLSLDFTGTYKKYMDRAFRHIYVSPVSVRTNAIISEWKPSTADEALIKMGMKQNALVPEKFKLADTAKNWADYLQAWSDYITGKPPLEKWPGGEPVMDLAFKLRNNIVAYTLMFSNRTTLVQFAALAQAYPTLGVRNLLSGVKDVMTSGSKGWDARNAISDTLLPRSENYDTAISEFADAVQNAPGLIETYTPVKGVRELATRARISKAGAAYATIKAVYYKLGSLLMSATDNLSAHFVWQGAYNKAMKPLDQGGLGLKSDPAARYADDVVNQTQGSSLRGEISPLQRYQAGKTVSVFQTYNINQWGNIVQDLAGIDMPNVSRQQGFKNIFKLMMGYAVANFIYEDILGMQSPFPTIFRRMLASMKAGDSAPTTAWKVAKEASEAGPFVSTVTKFGSHPLGAVAQLLSDTGAVIGERKGPQPSGYELAGKWVGFPGGGQIAKSVRAAKRPESDLYDIVMGNYTGDRDTMIREILFSAGKPKPPERPERPKRPKRL